MNNNILAQFQMDNLSSDHKKDTTGTSQKEYTVTYDSNIPSDDGEVWFTCSENSPASDKVKDGESYLQFNADGSGYLFYKNGSYTTLDTTCTWNTSTGGGKNWLNISDSNPGSSDGSYEYTVSTTTLRIHGRQAFGIPMDTEWNKQ